MKLFLSLSLCALALPACAQNTPKNGYDTLVAAGKMILPGENGSPSATEKFSAEENLRRQRTAVARNAPALKLLREALKQNIQPPQTEAPANLALSDYGAFRELARQLRQESDVRLADGDVKGALDSRLTGLELGVAITRDAPLINVLVAFAIEAITRKDFKAIGAKLDAAALRATLSRLKTLDERRVPYLQTLKVEKALTMRLLSAEDFFPTAAQRELLATPQGRAKQGLTDAEAQVMLALTPRNFEAQLDRAIIAIAARDHLPYALAVRTPLPPVPLQVSSPVVEIWAKPTVRFSYERNNVDNRLLQAALELRAIQLETGAYPLSFEAPLDPFGNNSHLIYKREGDNYRLYSVGPDGRGDGGAEIQTLETNAKTGIKSVSNRLTTTSTGDILAPVF